MDKKISLIKRDIIQSLLDNRNVYIGLTIIFLIINFIKLYSLTSLSEYSFIEIFIYIYGGIPFTKYLDSIQIPVLWLIINILIVFIVTNSIYKDFNSSSIYILTRSKNRYIFWISKLISIIVNVGIYYIIIFSSCIIIAVINPKIKFNSIIINNEIYTFKYVILISILLYIFTSILICFLSATLAVLMNPRYSILITIILILGSLFLDNWFLIAQGSLILRHVPFYNSGISLEWSLIYNLLGSLIISILGIRFISNKDII